MNTDVKAWGGKHFLIKTDKCQGTLGGKIPIKCFSIGKNENIKIRFYSNSSVNVFM